MVSSGPPDEFGVSTGNLDTLVRDTDFFRSADGPPAAGSRRVTSVAVRTESSETASSRSAMVPAAPALPTTTATDA